MNFPMARSESLVIQELSDEVLICDTTTYRAFCLNNTAAEVWKLCDGKNDTQQIANLLSVKLGSTVNEEIVWLALDQLTKENLLQKDFSSAKTFNGVSRREVIRRIGLASMVALPVISSLVMPTAANAQSLGACALPSGSGDVINGCPCNFRFDCDSGCCANGVCSDSTVCDSFIGTACTSNLDCLPYGLQCCAPSNPVCNPGC